MQSSFAQSNAGAIDLLTLVKLLWKDKIAITLATSVFAVGSVLLSLSMPNVYLAQATLSPTNISESPMLSGDLGGLASLAGFNVGGDQDERTNVALEILKSRRFLTDFVTRYDLTVPLIAASEWDHVNNTLMIEPEIYDEATGQWVREVSYPYTKVPSEWEIHQAFLDILELERDPETGMVKLSIEYFSPYLASEWVRLLIKDINEELRQRDREKALRSISYLEKELENTPVSSMKEIFFGLVEEQLKNKMLAEVTPEYAFDTIDPPLPSELKSGPKRALIVIAVTFLGFLLSALSILAYRTSGHRVPQ